jgi:hypothetical protein
MQDPRLYRAAFHQWGKHVVTREGRRGLRVVCNNGQEVSEIDNMAYGIFNNLSVLFMSIVAPAWSMYINLTCLVCSFTAITISNGTNVMSYTCVYQPLIENKHTHTHTHTSF